MADGCSALHKRHRSWCQRGGATQKSEWRPRKVHRIASKKWLQYTDNQIRQTTGLSGWKAFQYDEKAEKGSDANWRRWPSIGGSLDQGSDGLCSTNGLECHFMVNLRKYFDGSHGGHKDLQVALREQGLFDSILVLIIHAYVLHGPDRMT